MNLNQVNVTLLDNKTYLLYEDTNKDYLNSQYKYFQINQNSNFWDWITSKGTNFSCFVEYYDRFNEEAKIDNTISIVRTIVYALSEPFQSAFFYWTLLLFILHRFNFKKPVMKVILIHFVLRSIGDVLEKLGELMSNYFANNKITNKNGETIGYDCFYGTPSAEQHPLRWFLTRQIGNTFWYTGEIAADLYPLLRTRAVAKDDKSIWFVYISCACFNIAKIVLISIHYFLSPSELYELEENVFIFRRHSINMFYFLYWYVQLAVIMTSLIYDFTVFLVLKKNVFEISQSEFGFLKKFRTISEFRIIVSVVICITLLPVVFITYIFKYYFHRTRKFDNLNFSFDEVRRLIANIQYFMIFIDQILLLYSRGDSSFGETTNLSNIDSITNRNTFLKHSNIDSKLYYGNLANLSNISNNKNDRSKNSSSISHQRNNSNIRNSYLDSLPPSATRNSFTSSGTTRNSLPPSSTTRNSLPPSGTTRNSLLLGSNIRNSQRYSHPVSLMDTSFSGGSSSKTLGNNTYNITQRYSHPNTLMDYSFSGDINLNLNINTPSTSNNTSETNNNNDNNNNNNGKRDSTKPNKNKSIANYDDDDDYEGIPNEWSFIKK